MKHGVLVTPTPIFEVQNAIAVHVFCAFTIYDTGFDLYVIIVAIDGSADSVRAFAIETVPVLVNALDQITEKDAITVLIDAVTRNIHAISVNKIVGVVAVLALIFVSDVVDVVAISIFIGNKVPNNAT